ncbi:MAG: ribosomal subunit interface protein [Candidatus Handelsmanbacteria bacterium RIFCSPLOWO2_12_FULL_64_10]|uniref:Ribosomal subunit interface protein n=1 Tax=Handelsmanbacteria sp. (strain RIFCSPLOWO2_12_FULL_64_10) TaxID=1817868 RepID=A0A1F6CRZ9_HANXR|nr:MAG: ribosomal subunit interface protein [Candidatus Handelsmanbacteria bacterium RIFCSPLOWO2_12_FULL_64_10]
MKIQIVGRRFDVSDRLRSHVEKEAAKLEKLFDRIVDCQVFIGTERQMKEVEVIVYVRAHTLKATCGGNSVYQAVEEAMDKVKVQLKKLRDKLRERRRGGVKATKAAAAQEA